MNSVFVKVLVSDRLPKVATTYFTDEGECFFHSKSKRWSQAHGDEDVCLVVTWWLDEIDLPTLEYIAQESDKGWVRSHFKAGANFILDHIKKGGQNG